jgi:tetratricopeptide (TPR) repeat protein
LTPQARQTLLIALLTFGVVLATFLPTLRNDFVDFDDPINVYNDPMVKAGLTAEGFRWAWANPVVGDWIPLTTLSHMADCELFGLKPWGHHLTNALLHAAAAALLFVALREMSGALWPAAFAALLFGVHPQRVESVAWVTERKDVLSAFFFAGGLWAYAWYVRKRSVARYSAVAALYLCGLLAKSMVVTLPCVLLLLDYWPLRRFGALDSESSDAEAATRRQPLVALFLEKLPLFAIAAVFAVIQVSAVHEKIQAFTLSARAQTALVGYATYLEKMVWPANLAAIYPYPGGWPVSLVAASALLLITISILVVWFGRRRPYLVTGWCWYLGMIFPVIGFIQVGGQWMADRYSYLPSAGIFMLVAWLIEDLTHAWPNRRLLLWPAAAATILACSAASIRQSGYWSDSETLFRRTIALTGKNPLAHHLLGDALRTQGRTHEAMAQYKAAFAEDPKLWEARTHYALLREKEPGGLPEAIAQLEQAVALNPGSADGYNNLANALTKVPGRLPEAIARYREAIRLKPGLPEAHFNLGAALAQTPEGLPEAAEQFEITLHLRPSFPGAQRYLDLAHAILSQRPNAAQQP